MVTRAESCVGGGVAGALGECEGVGSHGGENREGGVMRGGSHEG